MQQLLTYYNFSLFINFGKAYIFVGFFCIFVLQSRSNTCIKTVKIKMRDYPKFLFSNPTNTKSKGPFIVHLLEPRLVFRVINYNTIVFLDSVFDTIEAEKIQIAALRWLQNQINKGNIHVSQFGLSDAENYEREMLLK
jgi:hypothetical protein